MVADGLFGVTLAVWGSRFSLEKQIVAEYQSQSNVRARPKCEVGRSDSFAEIIRWLERTTAQSGGIGEISQMMDRSRRHRRLKPEGRDDHAGMAGKR